jgi:hypothetical protein
MLRILTAPLLTAAFAFANVGPTVCAAIHAHAQAPAEHAHHGSHGASHAPATGDAWAPVPDAGHQAQCPDPAHCGVTLLGPTQRGAAVTVVLRPMAAPLVPHMDGTPRQDSAPATPPPRR